MGAKKEDDVELLQSFMRIGLNENTAKNTVVNAKLSANLAAVIDEANIENGCDKSVGNLLYTVAAKFPANALVHRPFLIDYVVTLKIKKQDQLEAALSFLELKGPENFEVKDFEEACGVGIDVPIEEIISTVEKVLEENKAQILEQRYRINVGNLCGQVRERHPWADARNIKKVIDEKLYELLGERNEADNEKPVKKKKEKAENVTLPLGVARPSE